MLRFFLEFCFRGVRVKWKGDKKGRIEGRIVKLDIGI